MSLTNLAIKRPIAILMLICALIVLGSQALTRMPVERDPRVEFPFITVLTTYPGAGPGEIETLVSKPIEDAVSAVNGVKNVTSVSQSGVSVITIEFALSTNSDVAAADVRARVDAVRAALPREIDAPRIQKDNTASVPILNMTMHSTTGRSLRDVRDLADRTVKDQLGQVAGVSSVLITGGDRREVRVALFKHRLDAYGLTVTEVAQAIRAQNLNVPSGRVIEGSRDYGVRVIGEFADADELRTLRLSFEGSDGQPDRTIRLTDLGRVEDTVAERTENATLSQRRPGQPNLAPGTDTVSLAIQKTSDGNTVDIARGIKKQMERLKTLLPPDIAFTITQDQSEETEENLQDVEVTLIIGAALAVLIVFFFLHNLRGTLIVALSIPTSIIGTFLVIQMLGFTLNSMTLLGLSLAVGILVDDSIVVLENIYRHLALGETPEEAARLGRSEIGLAAIIITLVDVVVFVPVAFMGGIVGQFFRSFGITVAVATLFSLLMSFTLAPMLASLWYRKGEYKEVRTGFFGAINRFYSGLEKGYERALRGALAHRGTTLYIGNMALILVGLWLAAADTGPQVLGIAIPLVVIQAVVAILVFLVGLVRRRRSPEPLIAAGIGIAATLAVAIASSKVGKPLGFRFAPEQNQGQIALSVELPAGASLEATTRVLHQIEERIADIPEIQYLETSAGATQGDGEGIGDTGTNIGEVRINLTDRIGNLDRILFWIDKSGLRIRSDSEIAEDIRHRVVDIPGATIRAVEVSGFNGNAAPVEIEVSGSNLDELVIAARKIRALLDRSEGILTSDLSYKASRPEVQIQLDRERAAAYGLSVQQISGALRDAIEGNTDAKFRDNGEQYDIRVQYDRLNRDSVADVGSVIVATRDGVPIRVADVARILDGRGPTKINRKNRQRQVVVTAYLKPGYDIGNVQQKLQPEVAKLDLGKAQIRWGGEADTMDEEGVYMITALGLAITLVYLLMAALFNNLLYPLIIMLSIPQALVGGLLGLIIAGKPLSIIAMIGVIMLMGLVTKNAILLVDYTNTLRERGYQREDALIEAGPTRLRPILMTTLAQILGALPIALALGKGSEFRQPLGIVVVGGLCLSALLTLLVIPCSYTIFDDISLSISRFTRQLFRRRQIE